MTPPKEVVTLYHLILKDRFGDDAATKEIESNKLKGQLRQVETRLSVLTDTLLDGIIDKDTYVQKRTAYKAEIDLLEDSLQMLDMQEDSFTKYLNYGCTLVGGLAGYYSQSSLPVQQKIVGSIFPGKLIYEDGIYRTTETNYFVELMCSKSEANEAKEKGQTMQVHNLPSWAPEAESCL